MYAGKLSVNERKYILKDNKFKKAQERILKIQNWIKRETILIIIEE